MSSTRGTVLVVGDGIVGMSTALACAGRGVGVRVIGRRLPGAASTAAAGLLAPSLGNVTPAVRAIMNASRDAWPEFAARLARESAIELTVNALGILEVATDVAEHDRLLAGAPSWAQPLGASELARLEPALAGAPGALLHRGDGAVDNVVALRALDAACASHSAIDRVDATVRSVEFGDREIGVITDVGRRYSADAVVIAAGAWAPAIKGLPRELPVAPARGQMLALDGVATAHCVAGEGGYLVPRGGRTLVGSTVERVGFEVATTDAAIESLRHTAASLVSALGDAREAERWAGLRPMSPDGLPIVGPDPAEPRVVYGCGLSKNGILLAPLVADALAAWCSGAVPAHDLRPFAIGRFFDEKA